MWDWSAAKVHDFTLLTVVLKSEEKTKTHRIFKHGAIVGETEGSRIRTVSETYNLIVVGTYRISGDLN